MNINMNEIKMKVCNQCKQEKYLTEEFYHTGKRYKDGFRGTCRVCRNENNRKYKKENSERVREYNKIYREENAGAIRERRKKNKARAKEYSRTYYEQNSHKFKLSRQKRRAKGKKLLQTLTPQQWEEIKRDFNYECAYCGIAEEEHIKKYDQRLHQEHFVPLSKGGEFTHNNIITACAVCNRSKSDRNFFDWYKTSEHYSKEREKKILEYLDYVDEGIQQLSIL